jgi:hypothetical protein
VDFDQARKPDRSRRDAAQARQRTGPYGLLQRRPWGEYLTVILDLAESSDEPGVLNPGR